MNGRHTFNDEDLSAEELLEKYNKSQQTPPLRQMKLDLKEFWTNFDPCGPGPNQCIGKCRSKEYKIKILKKYAEKNYQFKKRISLDQRREQFRKAKRLRNKFRWPCFVCGGEAEARHHIIELQGGATNAKRNVIPICHRCHALIHPWLEGKSLRKPFTSNLTKYSIRTRKNQRSY